jgi:hypothetical protein
MIETAWIRADRKESPYIAELPVKSFDIFD